MKRSSDKREKVREERRVRETLGKGMEQWNEKGKGDREAVREDGKKPGKVEEKK